MHLTNRDIFADHLGNARVEFVAHGGAQPEVVQTSSYYPFGGQEVTYTPFDKVETVTADGNSIRIEYGHDRQRIRMTEKSDKGVRVKTYVGGCEFITDDGAEKVLTYLTGPYGVFAVVVEEAGVESIHYIYKDHLGSWTTVTDSDGKVEQRQSFDAWGNRRNASTWSGPATDEPMFDRGFTGHEHLYAFGLINMNGRVYDPLMSSFFSPDILIQDPTSQQGFNRYAYCLYNPLKYVDPSGYRCDDPPYWQQVQQYLTCMNRENAECLNAVGITHVQVNSSSGYSGSYVMYDVAGESYGYHYNGYVDTGYHDGYGGQTTYSDGSLPTPPTPMCWNEGGGCGGGAASSGGGFSHPVVPVGMLGTSALLTYGEKSFYNTNSNTWRGKNGKLYDMNFNGNQHTGGKYKYGRRISKFFKTGNLILGATNAYYIYIQYENGEIDGYEAICEEVANVISQLGWFGVLFNVGWEGVQYLRSTQQYQELKFNIQYNRELRYLGEPNQVNQELWDEWYKNYRP